MAGKLPKIRRFEEVEICLGSGSIGIGESLGELRLELKELEVPFILGLDMSGMPNRWLFVEQAITYHARDMVAWSLGRVVCTYHGGISRVTGERSSLSTKSIIAIKGAAEFVRDYKSEPHLTNHALYRRDRHVCGYCGGRFREYDLSRDHVVPLHLGGRDRWMNVVTACRRCNTLKGGRTPESARMPCCMRLISPAGTST